MFVAGIVVCRIARKRFTDDTNAVIVMLFSSIGVIIGGHILYGITNIKYIPLLFEAQNIAEFIKAAQVIFGGSVFYGGLFGAIIAATITIKLKKLDFIAYSDVISLAIPLFHCFARIGCFLGGCCYGVESDLGFTVTNNNLVPEINGVSRFPIQLLESVLNLIIFYIFFIRNHLHINDCKGKYYLYILYYIRLYGFLMNFCAGMK